MRYLHIADLHLGKQMNDVSLLEDQEHILSQITAYAKDEDVDLVLIAGDVYQRAAPQAEAMALFGRFVSGLADMGRKVFVISGNHDSDQRISYFSGLLRQANVYMSEVFNGRLQSVQLSDGYGPVRIFMLPFVRAGQVRRYIKDEPTGTTQDAVRAVLRQAEEWPEERKILMCHQFVTGAVTSDSEDLTVGGLDSISVNVFDGFDYVALGHIHRPQKLGRETLRYAGSPLKYSFSEAAFDKSAVLVDMGQKGDVVTRLLPLKPLRDVRLVKGTMRELMAAPYSEDYVWVTVCDELVPPDARVTLSVVFPNMLRFSVVNSATASDVELTPGRDVGNRSVSELFDDFYRLQNSGSEMTPAHRRVLERALRGSEEEK